MRSAKAFRLVQRKCNGHASCPGARGTVWVCRVSVSGRCRRVHDEPGCRTYATGHEPDARPRRRPGTNHASQTGDSWGRGDGRRHRQPLRGKNLNSNSIAHDLDRERRQGGVLPLGLRRRNQLVRGSAPAREATSLASRPCTNTSCGREHAILRRDWPSTSSGRSLIVHGPTRRSRLWCTRMIAEGSSASSVRTSAASGSTVIRFASPAAVNSSSTRRRAAGRSEPICSARTSRDRRMPRSRMAPPRVSAGCGRPVAGKRLP